MEEKVNSLFEDSTAVESNAQSKINAIESIADIAEETELETSKVLGKTEVATPTNTVKVVSSKDNNKMWTLAVVGSVLILIASAVGMVLILLRG